MGITRWNPFADMITLHDAMDRLLADSFVRPGGGQSSSMDVTMPIDMYEENDQLIVKTSMPGVKSEDVSVEVQDNVLTITGEVKRDKGTNGDGEQAQGGSQPKAPAQSTQPAQNQGQTQQQGNGQKWYVREHQYARFVRSVTLPYPVQAEKAEAVMENGMLTLKLPKSETAKQQKIQVKAR